MIGIVIECIPVNFIPMVKLLVEGVIINITRI